MIVPTVLVWKSSILWVAFVSIWALIISHATAWIAARDEVRLETMEKKEKSLENAVWGDPAEKPREAKPNKERKTIPLPYDL